MNKVLIRCGRLAAGISIKPFETPAAAHKFATKAISKKHNKGHTAEHDVAETTEPASGVEISPLQLPLEHIVRVAAIDRRIVAVPTETIPGDFTASLTYSDGASDKFYEVSITVSHHQMRRYCARTFSYMISNL